MNEWRCKEGSKEHNVWADEWPTHKASSLPEYKLLQTASSPFDVHSPIIHSPIHFPPPPIHSPTHSFPHQFILPTHPSFPPIHPSNPSIRIPIQSFIHPLICPCIIHSSPYLSIHYSFIHFFYQSSVYILAIFYYAFIVYCTFIFCQLSTSTVNKIVDFHLSSTKCFLFQWLKH